MAARGYNATYRANTKTAKKAAAAAKTTRPSSLPGPSSDGLLVPGPSGRMRPCIYNGALFAGYTAAEQCASMTNQTSQLTT